MDTRRIWRVPASATEGPAGILDSASRSPTKRSVVDMPGSAAAVESPREMRARASVPQRSGRDKKFKFSIADRKQRGGRNSYLEVVSPAACNIISDFRFEIRNSRLNTIWNQESDAG